jgi:hypothetical protein
MPRLKFSKPAADTNVGYAQYMGRAGSDDMKINANADANPVRADGPMSPTRPAPAHESALEQVSFSGSTAINNALQGTADSRPEAVERARSLISDPGYPGAGVLKQVSNLLAGKLGGDSDGDGDSK